ncbi:hypothetical protein LCGC14_1786150, partial [marine sediment metagenome]
MGEFLIESTDRIALSSGSFKLRVKNVLPIVPQSSVEALKRHIIETNYFLAWADQVRRFRSDFSNNEVREAVKQEFGGAMLGAIDEMIRVCGKYIVHLEYDENNTTDELRKKR